MAKNKKDASFIEMTADFLEIVSLYLRVLDERNKLRKQDA